MPAQSAGVENDPPIGQRKGDREPLDNRCQGPYSQNDKGDTEKWSCEARSPIMLVRVGGWDKSTLKPGDVITASGYRTKNGSNMLRLQKIVLSDGRVMANL